MDIPPEVHAVNGPNVVCVNIRGCAASKGRVQGGRAKERPSEIWSPWNPAPMTGTPSLLGFHTQGAQNHKATSTLHIYRLI